MDYGSVAHQDVSAQTQNIGTENMRQVQGRVGGKRHHAPRTPCGYSSRRKETPDGNLGRHLTAMGCQSNPQRSTAASNDGTSRTGKTTARASMRAMRSHQP